MTSPACRTALDFVDRINRHDVRVLAQAMPPDHVFIDTAGNSMVGRDAVRDAWTAYYELFPDYHIEVERVLSRGDLVILFGRTTGMLSDAGRRVLAGPGGTLPSDELQGPAIWTAVVHEGLISQWRVYLDDEGVRSSLGVD